MHPRNPYTIPLDYERIFASSSANPELQKHFTFSEEYQNRSFEFTQEGALQELTKELLRVDFGVDWPLRKDRLCPPLPNRLNCLLWLQDVCEGWALLRRLRGVAGKLPQITVDVGTGSSAIFALLANKALGMQVLGTDIDASSLSSALENVSRNGLEKEIALCLTSADLALAVPDVTSAAADTALASSSSSTSASAGSGPSAAVATLPPAVYRLPSSSLLPDAVKKACEVFRSSEPLSSEGDEEEAIGKVEGPRIAFTVCNPPFFGSWDEAKKSMEAHDASNCSGSPQEMACGGGEVAFVSKMIGESLMLGKTVLLYSSMFGKASSAELIQAKLAELKVPTVRTAELVQGKTKRWVVAWSFFAEHEFLMSGWTLRLPGDKLLKRSLYAVSTAGSGDSSGALASSSFSSSAALGTKRSREARDENEWPGDEESEGQASKRPRLDDGGNDGEGAKGGRAPKVPLTSTSVCRLFSFPLTAEEDPMPISTGAVGSARLTVGVEPLAVASSTASVDGLPSLSLGEVQVRVEEAIAKPFTPVTSPDDADVRFTMRPSAEPVVLFSQPCLRCWFGEASIAASDAAASHLSPSFTCEVQILQGKRGSIAVVTVSLLSLASPAALNRQRFERWADRFKADVERTSRRWRRRGGNGKQEEGGGAGEGVASTEGP